MNNLLIAQAFALLLSSYHLDNNLGLPAIELNTHKIQTDCQAVAMKGYEALSCYDSKTRTVYLPDNWQGETMFDKRLLLHELDRDIEQVYLGRIFTTPEPDSVLIAEKFAIYLK